MDFYETALDSDRFPEPPMQVALAELLQKRSAARHFDLIVPIGAPAAQFVVQNRERIFPGTPAVFIGVDSRLVKPESLRGNATLINPEISPATWVEDILQMAPDTTDIAVVSGVSPLEQFWEGVERRDFQIFSHRVHFTYINELSLDEIEKRVSALPPHSFILFGLLVRDAAGISYAGYEPLRRMHAAANAPIYGVFESQLGLGTVGGRLLQDKSMGIQAAQAAARILRGEPAERIPVQILEAPPPEYDWRELKRWGISESRLPTGSLILFREPTFWTRYRWRIVGVISLLLFETLLIVGLLTNLLKRRRVERSFRMSEERYRRLFAAASDAFFLMDSETGRFHDANAAAEKMYGYSREELLRLKARDLSAEPEKADAAITAGETYISSARHRRKDGTIFPVEISGSRFDDGTRRFHITAIRDVTERLRAEEMLRQSEQKYRRLHASMMDAFVSVDMAGRIQEFNPAYQNMLGYPEEELRRLTYLEITPERWHEFEAQIIREQVLQRGYSDIYEKEYRRKDGTVFPVELRTSLLRDDLAEPRAMWAIVRDLTERKQRETALRESQERLLLAAEAAEFGAFSNDAVSGRVFFTPELLALHGLPPGTSIQLDAYNVPEDLHPEDRDRFQAHVLAAGDPCGSGILDIEYRIIRPDGQIRWLRMHGRTVFSDNRPLRSDGVVQDITERKRSGDALRATEERFRQVAEAVSDFIWEVDSEGLYRYTSPSVEKILGYRPDELIGKMHFYDLFALDVREQLKTTAFQAFATRQRFDKLPNSNISKTGKIVHIETSGVPILDEAGQLLGYRGADTDVTERRQREMEAQLLREELAHYSRVATVTELTASLAHELNQPLTAILGNAQAALHLIESDTLDLKELREIFDDIVADDRRAAEVIRSLRSMLKKGVVENQPLLLNDLIKDVVPIVRNDALMRNVSVDLDLGSPLPSIQGDRVQLQQVILNLIVNAFEAMDTCAQPRKLLLRTREADGEVVLDVVDSGTGIFADKLDSIFEPFVTTKTNGLGMGLSLSRSIVIAHNGRLWAENNAEGGATFHMALPIEKSLPRLRTETAVAASQSDAGQRSPGLTVLVVDDRASFRHAVASMLTDLPQVKLISEAGDGSEAVTKAAELKPDLILLDVGLPKMNGVEAAARIGIVAPNSKILFLSQYDSPDFVRAALRTGARGYILKVDVGSELLSAAAAVLRGDQYLSSGIQRRRPADP